MEPAVCNQKEPNHNALNSYTEGSFQDLQRYYASSSSKTRFLNTLFQFLKHKGDESVFSHVPMLGGSFVDFYSLYRTTERNGGYDMVTRKHLWGSIARELNIITYMEGTCNPLRKWYEKFLRNFEEVIRMKVAKHQMEKAAAAAAAAAAGTAASTGPNSSTSASSTTGKHSGHLPPSQSQPPSKRPRVDPPAPSEAVVPSTTPFVPKNEAKRVPERVIIDKASVDMAVKNIQSRRLADVVKGLNYLNQASMEPDQIQLNANRSPFYIDRFPMVVMALGDLLESLNPCVNDLFPPTDYTITLLDQSDQYFWNTSNPVDQYEHIRVRELLYYSCPVS
jgi:hypothetical protein